ncbi:hypothetical protein [Flammeovirga aprica]|uniref:Uncharacterized protein n=1 Tax=Flammeovirga aprica JL-4 TaxID=694437 RepID=A0A7X9XDE3_9BACT|nr:hypothetical protein [Flammeovirga aprica]NME72762.1 hypothetical protein [Flammeovirga aprica JL-4]
MKVNISYYLDECGWSSCWIYSDDKLYELSITHIYLECPIYECLNALIGIMEGQIERKFNWYGEPGGDQIIIREIPTDKHKVLFKVIGFSEDYGEEIGDLERFPEKVELQFEIKKIQLIRMFYFEFKKISVLMKDNQFAEKRNNDFPFKKFTEFEQIAKEYTKL